MQCKAAPSLQQLLMSQLLHCPCAHLTRCPLRRVTISSFHMQVFHKGDLAALQVAFCLLSQMVAEHCEAGPTTVSSAVFPRTTQRWHHHMSACLLSSCLAEVSLPQVRTCPACF